MGDYLPNVLVTFVIALPIIAFLSPLSDYGVTWGHKTQSTIIVNNTTCNGTVYHVYNNNTEVYQSESNSYHYGEMGRFESIAKSVAELNDYKPDIFDCDEFVEETIRWYRRLGWKAHKKVVQVDCSSDLFDLDTCEMYDGWHSIVCIGRSVGSCALYVEATTGEIIEPKNYEVYGI